MEEYYLMCFCTEDSVGPLQIASQEYVVVKFLATPAFLKIESKQLHIHLNQTYTKAILMESFITTLESAIHEVEIIVDDARDIIPHLYLYLPIVGRLPGTFLSIEATKGFNNDLISILHLEFQNQYFTLDQLVNVHNQPTFLYKIGCLDKLVWQSSNDDSLNSINIMCIVCLEEYADDEVVSITSCNHVFHQECIMRWFRDHFRCPICRIRPSFSVNFSI